MEIERLERGYCSGCGLHVGDRVGIASRHLASDGDGTYALCDDCLAQIVRCAGWEVVVGKEGAAPTPEIEWRGEPGHFCAADACVFHLHTHVNGKWCVSTVGEWYPRGTPRQANRGPETIGSDRLYETMVFRVVGKDIDLSELEMASYNDREAAQKGHVALVEKYGGMP
jgi:hypothetical protein